MEEDPGCEIGRRKEDIVSEVGMHRADGENECGQFHDSCQHEDVRPLPSNETFDEEGVNDVVAPASHDGDMSRVVEAANREVSICRQKVN